MALSSTEAEYMSLSTAIQEALWLRVLTRELRIQDAEPTTVAKNANFSPRTKHINVRYHFIKEKMESRDIAVEFTASNYMLADSLTKSVTGAKLNEFTQNIAPKQFY